MAERVYPAAKPAAPATNGTAGAGAGAPAFPASKAQMYGASRPAYRPQPPKPRRSRRGCCCCCCCWLTLLLVALVLLAAIAGGVFYVLYRPQRPSFSVDSLRLSALNVTAANALTSRLDISVSARNPNKKLVFLYDATSVAVSTGGVQIGDGSFPAFVHGAKNTTLLKASVTSSGRSLDSAAAADLRKKSSLPLEIQMETRAGVKVGSLKTKKIRIRVSCGGVSVAVPRGKAAPPPAASSPNASCKVDLRIKIWKWYI